MLQESVNHSNNSHMMDVPDKERFTELNIHGFSAIEVFTEIFLCCLAQKCSLFSIIKERRLYSQKNLHGTENRESLAQ